MDKNASTNLLGLNERSRENSSCKCGAVQKRYKDAQKKIVKSGLRPCKSVRCDYFINDIDCSDRRKGRRERAMRQDTQTPRV